MTAALARFQRDFLAGMLAPFGVAIDGGAGAVSTDLRGLAIHGRNWQFSHHRALLETFPILGARLGANTFAHLSAAYRRWTCPRSGNLDDYGAELATFLRADAVHGETPVLPPWAIDVARLDWAIHRAFIAADAMPDPARADAPPFAPAEVRLRRHPAAALVRSAFALDALRTATTGNRRECDAIAATGPQCVLVTRPGNDVLIRAIAAADAEFVERVLRGDTLEQALDGGGTDAPSAADMLRLLVQSGAVLGVRDGGRSR